jgi:soluble lytic murein transglycosylase-like protein
MTRLTVTAAALVAGMTAFAANAQEAPARAAAMADAVAAKGADAGTTMIVRTGRGSAVAVPAGESTPVPSKADQGGKPKKVVEAKPKKAADAQPKKVAGTQPKKVAEAKPTKASAKVAKGRKSLATSEEYEQGMVFAPIAATAETAPQDNSAGSAVHEQGMVVIPEVDPTKTASTGKRKRPELVAVARKSVKGDAAEIVADAKAVGSAGGGQYGVLISRYAASYGVPVALAHAVIRVESNYRPNARGRAGEIGLMQIKPATARAMGYSGGAAGLYNPETNIRFGMKYLAMAHQLGGGSTCGTILKYNAGHGARRMNPVSAAYCSKVKRHLGS